MAQKEYQQLPKISGIYNIDNANSLLAKALPTTGKIVFVFYDPGCGHCQQLGSAFSNKIKEMSGLSLFFISMNDKEYVDGFINMFAKNLKGRTNVSFWKDPGVEFIEKFKPTNYPATYIYDAAKRTLIASFQGENDLFKMLPFLK